MKNLNSFAFIKKAINFEFKRQVDNVLEHKTIEQETRRYDEKSKKTYSMRKKEDADDYIYFPYPDLPRIKLQTDYVENIKKNLPKLATIRKSQIMEKYDLSSYDCEMLLSKPELYDLFEKSALYTTAYKTLSNLIISKKDCILSISAEKIARIADISCQELINISTAKKLIDMLIKEDFDVDETIKKEKMYQINDMDILTCYTRQALLINKKAVESYKKGNLLAVGPIIGHVMKLTNGYGNPETVKNIVTKMLSDIN